MATLRYIRHERNSGLGVARNTAARAASGTVLAYTDDDCTVAADWVRRIGEVHREHPELAGAGGLVHNGLTESRIAEIGQQIVSQRLHDGLLDGNHTRFLVGNNQTYKKAAVERIGFFNEELIFGGEDAEMSARLDAAGERLMFVPEIQVTHFQRSTLRSFLKQYYRYGLGLYLIKKKMRLTDSPVLQRERRSLFERVAQVVSHPFHVARRLDRALDRVLCYPLVYLSSASRVLGVARARLGDLFLASG